MNHLIGKIYNHKKLEGNILILVILVMLTVSMMGLLTMSILKQMFNYTINLDGYYKSYYLSKAGLELALTEIDNSDVGFSNVITGNNNIFTKNLCSGGDCSVDLNIKGRSNYLSNMFWLEGCTTGTAFTLAAGESFALPLFYQSAGLSNRDILEGSGKDSISYIISQLNNIKLDFPLEYQQGSLNLSLVFPDLTGQLDNLYIASYGISEDAISNFEAGLQSNKINLSTIGNTKLYLMISNSNEYDVQFCLKEGTISKYFEMPATKFYVVSLGNYQGKYVGLQAIYAQPIPSFMFYGYDGHGSAVIRNE